MKTSIAIGALALTAVAGSANAGIVDSFTIAGSSDPGGPSAPIVNTSGSGSLFDERQVVRLGSSSAASVGSGAWTASLPASGNSSFLHVRQRPGDSISTIDLSGIASMSFDIAVTGSLFVSWYILDENGFYITILDPDTLSAGSSTQTLNFSTADIDAGFDISKVVASQIWIVAESANSSFAVTNYTYALVPTPGAAAVLGLGGLLATRRRR